jgi:predicted PhzF superfamily epimerase YddE/YHI9
VADGSFARYPYRLAGLVRGHPDAGQDRVTASRAPFYFVDVFASDPLTGNPLSGAWLWMHAAGRLPPIDRDARFRQEIAGHVLPVEIICPAGEPAAVWMDQPPPHFGAVAQDRDLLAAALGLAEDDPAAGESTVIVEQGYALGRPSRIQVSASGQRIRVGGSGLVVAEGTLAL